MLAFVLGGAACLWDDLYAAEQLYAADSVIAVNNAGIDYPQHLDHLVSLHPDATKHWPGLVAAVEQRIALGRNRPSTWTYKPTPGIDHHLPDWAGSSGLFATRIALHLGYRVILCGVPMDGGPYYHKRRRWAMYGRYRPAWQRRLPTLQGRVSSMSGWTRELLGAPDGVL